MTKALLGLMFEIQCRI